MGDPRRQKQKYAKPKRPFENDRFEQELKMVGAYGLRNKRELWKHRTELSRYRRIARALLALPPEDRVKEEQELITKLTRYGILKTEPTLENVLDLTLPDVLERRLQTIVFRKGLAASIYHARQLIVHGHIGLNQARVRTPSRVITLAEEEHIGYVPKSPLNNESHPARVAAVDAAGRAASIAELEEAETRKTPLAPKAFQELAADEIEAEDVDEVDRADLGSEEEKP